MKHLLLATSMTCLLANATLAGSLTQLDLASVEVSGGPAEETLFIERTRYLDSDGLPLGSRPFWWNQANGLRDLGDLPRSSSTGGAWAIRDGAVIAGYSATEPVGGAFMWRNREDEPEGMISLGDLPGGGDQSRANDLNAQEEVVGWGTAEDGKRAFFWTEEDGLRDLNTMVTNLPEDVVLADARAIGRGPMGNVVGIARSPEGDRAFFWNGSTGEVELIEGPEGVIPRAAIAMSTLGNVLVQAQTERGVASYIWNASDGLRPVEGRLGDRSARAHSVNAVQTAVGVIGDGDARRAVRWDSGGRMVDLNSSVIDLPEGLTLDSAMAINDHGQIATYGHFGAPAHHLFVLTPEYIFADSEEGVVWETSFPAGLGPRYRLVDLGEVLVDGVDMPPVGIDENGEIAGQCELTAAACPYLSEHFGEVQILIDDEITNLFGGPVGGPTFSSSSRILGLGSNIGGRPAGVTPQVASFTGGPTFSGGPGGGQRPGQSFSDPVAGPIVIGGGPSFGPEDTNTPTIASPIPLPAGIWLMVLALGGLFARGRRRSLA